MNWCNLAADGVSGGILLLWDLRILEVVDHCMGSFFVSVVFKDVEDGVQWIFFGVYGPNDVRNRRLLWEELTGIFACWSLPRCIGGDFNVT